MILDQVLQSQDSAAVTSARAADQLRTAIEPFVKEIMPIAGMIQDGGSEMTDGFAGILDFFNNIKQTTEIGQKIVDEQGKQIIATDKMTQSAIKAQIALENYARALDSLVLEGMGPTAAVVEQIAKIFEAAAGDVSGRTEGATQKLMGEYAEFAKVKATELVVDNLATKAVNKENRAFANTGNPAQDAIANAIINEKLKSNYLGGTVGAKEISLVGERGPEIIAGPASVISTSTSERILQNMTGPKSSYTPMSASVASVTETMTAPEPMSTTTRSDNSQTDLLKTQVNRLDQMIEILTKGNRIGQQQVRATYS